MMLINAIKEYDNEKIKNEIRKSLNDELFYDFLRIRGKDDKVSEDFFNDNKDRIIDNIINLIDFDYYSFNNDYNVSILTLNNLNSKGDIPPEILFENVPKDFPLSVVNLINDSVWNLFYHIQTSLFEEETLLFDFLDDSYTIKVIKPEQYKNFNDTLQKLMLSKIEEWSSNKIKEVRKVRFFDINHNKDSMCSKLYKNRVNEEKEKQSALIEEKIKEFSINFDEKLSSKIIDMMVEEIELQHVNKLLLSLRDISKNPSIYLENKSLQKYYPVLDEYLNYLKKNYNFNY